MFVRVVRRASRPLRALAARYQFARLYEGPHGNLDRATHLREAIGWLQRAHETGTDSGVSYGARFGEAFLPSYPETTGYIIQTFVELASLTNESYYLERACAMGDWEIDVQMQSGAVMGGMFNSSPTPAVFNTGQVLLGWAALLSATRESRYAAAAHNAARWLLEKQEANGHWLDGNSRYALSTATVYNVKAAWGLAEAGVVLGESRYVEAAARNAEFCLTKQRSNGWFEDCCLNNPDKPLLHTLAYTLQGLIGIGKLLGRDDFIDAADKTASALRVRMRRDGFLQGRYDSNFRGAAYWCCLTGSAQMSIVWSELFLLGRSPAYRAAVSTINDYLCRHHDITNSDPTIRGGVAGSWPVWGEYGRFRVLNWAAKFFVDALLREAQIVGRQAIAKGGSSP